MRNVSALLLSTYRRICAFLTVLAIVICAAPLPAGVSAESGAGNPVAQTATGEFAGGSGTEADPYLIATKEHLNNVRNDLDAYYKLIADITFTDADFAIGGDFYNNGNGWMPIGSSTTSPFAGSFDGNGKSIKGLQIKITASVIVYAGLFGCCSGGNITNLTMDGGSIEVRGSTEVYAGGICAYSANTNFVGCNSANNLEVIVHAESTGVEPYSYVGGISGYGGNCTNCENSGNITTEVKVYNDDYDFAYCGGIVGGYSGTISNCSNYGDISACSTSTWTVACIDLGGIAGSTSKTISGCENFGNISCSANNMTSVYAGGICGSFSGTSLELSYNAGIITGPHAGGIAGSLRHGAISNCYNLGEIISSDYAGGIVGYVTYNGEVHNCYNVGILNGSDSSVYIGGITGYMSSGISANCCFIDTITGGTGRGSAITVKLSADEMRQNSSYTGFDFVDIWEFKEKNHYLYPTLIDNPYFDGDFAGGSGTEEDPYLISTKEHLNNVRNYLDAHYKMVADIVFTDADFAEGGAFYNDGAGWEPIGINNQAPFSGVFDGNGRTISGLYISISTTESFASYTELYVGLFGYATGTIQSLSLDKVIYSVYDNFHGVYVGGLVGYSTAEIKNVSVFGQIAATSGTENVYVAGISGLSQGSIGSSHFDGAVTGKTTLGKVYAAGVAGQASVVISSNNAGSVSAICSMNENYTYAGGISGYGGNISKCYNEGTIKADSAGGISGSNSTIALCYNKGVIADAVYAGGILGKNGQISDCYNLGDISATLYAGGIVGLLSGNYVKNCYNLSDVRNATYTGCIAGGNHGTIYSEDNILAGGTISACYYPGSHAPGIGRGSGSTTACTIQKLKEQRTFSGFDFESIWTMAGNENYLYPELIEIGMNIAVTNFEITTLPTKKTYLEGKDSLNLTGATGQVTYSTGLEDNIDITSEMVSGFDNTVVGNQVLTVSFGGKTDTFSVEITAKKLTSISINTLPDQTTYLEGTGQLDLTGATIVLSFDNGHTDIMNVTHDMVSGFDNNILGNQFINITYGGKETRFLVNIIEKTIDRIEIHTKPTKLTYIAMSDTIDVTGGMLTVYYNNGTNEEIGITATMASGFDNGILGSNEITISYGGKSAVYTVEIVENTRDYLKGVGTEDNPYVISTIAHLNNIRNHPTSYYILANDITFDPECEEFPTGWKPFAFKGFLDGQGYKISNLRITENKTSGLFSANAGTIKNLTIEGACISITNYGGEFGGFICAENSGDIINCHSKECTISITSAYRLFGGIAGNNSGSITNCTSNNSITWESVGGHVGGIVSTNTGIIENCTNWTSIVNNGAEANFSGGIAAKNSGTIRASKNLANISAKRTSGSVYSAGIVAQMTGGSILQCYSTGNVSAEAAQYNNSSVYAGGIVANITSGQISDCYSTGDVNGKSQATASSSASTYVGGIVGYNNTISDISNCYAVGTASGSARSSNLYVGYVCGYNATNTIRDSYYLGIPDNGAGLGDATNMYGKTVVELKEEVTYANFDFDSTWTMSGNSDYPFPELVSVPMVYEKEIKSISIESMPAKLQYIQNYELLDVAGGTLKITYKYGDYETISLAEATLSGFNNSVVGKQNITVSYLGCTTEFEVKIVKTSLDRIEVVTLPDKVTYYEGDTFTSAGMIVMSHYNDETSEPITGYTVTGFSSAPGTKTITVQYMGKTDTFEVTVIKLEVVSIDITTKPTKLTYLEGESFNYSGMVITAHYNNGTNNVVTNYTVSGYSSTPGSKTITVTYGGKTATFNVTVTAKTLTGISITTKPTKLTYTQGESLNTAGLVVKAAYNNGTSANVTGYTVTGYDANKVGQQTVTVTYSGKTATFAVTVIARVPSAITSSKYTVSGGYLRKISLGTKVSELVNGLNEKQYIKVFNGNQEVSGNTLLGTGMVVKLMDGNTVKASVMVVVTGDTSGDGQITVTDLLAVKAHILEKSTLTGAAALAADTSNGGGISVTDFIQIKAAILGISAIVPN